MPKFRVVVAPRLIEFYGKDVEAETMEGARAIVADDEEGIDDSYYRLRDRDEVQSEDIVDVEYV
jgi:hypothetical protein